MASIIGVLMKILYSFVKDVNQNVKPSLDWNHCAFKIAILEEIPREHCIIEQNFNHLQSNTPVVTDTEMILIITMVNWKKIAGWK